MCGGGGAGRVAERWRPRARRRRARAAGGGGGAEAPGGSATLPPAFSRSLRGFTPGGTLWATRDGRVLSRAYEPEPEGLVSSESVPGAVSPTAPLAFEADGGTVCDDEGAEPPKRSRREPAAPTTRADAPTDPPGIPDGPDPERSPDIARALGAAAGVAAMDPPRVPLREMDDAARGAFDAATARAAAESAARAAAASSRIADALLPSRGAGRRDAPRPPRRVSRVAWPKRRPRSRSSPGSSRAARSPVRRSGDVLEGRGGRSGFSKQRRASPRNEPLPETVFGGGREEGSRARRAYGAAGGFGVTARARALASCARGDGGGAAEVAEWIASRDLVGRKRRLDADAKRARGGKRASTFFPEGREERVEDAEEDAEEDVPKTLERTRVELGRAFPYAWRASDERRTTSTNDLEKGMSRGDVALLAAVLDGAATTTTTRFGTLRTPSGSGRRRGGSARTRARGGRRTRSALRQTLKTLKTLNRYLTREPRFETERARGARRRPTRRGRRFWRAGPTLPRRRLKNERMTPGGGRRRPRRGEKSARLFVSSRG